MKSWESWNHVRWLRNGVEKESLLLQESCKRNSSEQTLTSEVELDGGSLLERWGMD